jgi:hypothetical protein
MTSKLTDEQKAYVVRRLAEYDKPMAIVHGLKEVFGVAISHQAIEHYDPERPAGHDLAQKWRDVFWLARKAFIESTADVGAMRKEVRIRVRERMMRQEWEAGRCKIANEILDSISKASTSPCPTFSRAPSSPSPAVMTLCRHRNRRTASASRMTGTEVAGSHGRRQGLAAHRSDALRDRRKAAFGGAAEKLCPRPTGGADPPRMKQTPS